MAEIVLVDAGFLTGLLRRRDQHRDWAASQAEEFQRPWHTCEAVLSEAFHLLGSYGESTLIALLRRGAVRVSFELSGDQEPFWR